MVDFTGLCRRSMPGSATPTVLAVDALAAAESFAGALNGNVAALLGLSVLLGA